MQKRNNGDGEGRTKWDSRMLWGFLCFCFFKSLHSLSLCLTRENTYVTCDGTVKKKKVLLFLNLFIKPNAVKIRSCKVIFFPPNSKTRCWSSLIVSTSHNVTGSERGHLYVSYYSVDAFYM